MASRFTLFGKRNAAAEPTTSLVEDQVVQALATSRDERAGATVGAVAPPPPSFEEVYETYFGFVWRNVLNRGVPSSAVDDVVQEVFMVVHRKLPGFEGRSSLRTWLAGVVRRVVMDHVRKRGNAPAGDEPLAAESVSPARGPGEELDAKAAVSALDELLSSMPETQREVFILHEIEEMTGREIADAVGANENTVHTRLRAARRLFKEGLARLRGE
jgi:RNA polymerase sigma-70 factor (ECF subfamily)